jgi:hypothetical protein
VIKKTVGLLFKLTKLKSSNRFHRPPPSNSAPIIFNRRLFDASTTAPHSDNLLQNIPPHTQAISAIKSDEPQRIPYRDLPSILLTYLASPALSSEPPWRALIIDHLNSPSTLQPDMILQNLYIWVARVGIPNAVIDNRRFLLHFYLSNPLAATAFTLRYDYQNQGGIHVPLVAESQTQAFIANRSIFRDYPTPNGARFVQWLASPPHAPKERKAPKQTAHRASMLDGYLDEDELATRKVDRRAIVERTVRVLKMFWDIWVMNRKLLEVQDRCGLGGTKQGQKQGIGCLWTGQVFRGI